MSLGEFGLASQAGEVRLAEGFVVLFSIDGVLLQQLADLAIQFSLSLAFHFFARVNIVLDSRLFFYFLQKTKKLPFEGILMDGGEVMVDFVVIDAF